MQKRSGRRIIDAREDGVGGRGHDERALQAGRVCGVGA
jgi:hypothetical protein